MAKDYEKGDLLIDAFGIYKVLGIEDGKDVRGKDCQMLVYEPVWGTDKKYTARLPVDNIDKTGMRSLMTKEEAEDMIKNMTKDEKLKEYNSMEMKEELYENKPKKIAPFLRYLWKNQETIGKADKDMLEQAMEHFCQELSFVTKRPYQQVKNQIVGVMEKEK